MSGCDRRLGALLDGELGAQERGAVEEHLAGCVACREEFEGLRSDADSLRRALGGLLLHVDLPAMVMVGLPEKRRSAVLARTQGIRRRLALAGFAVAAVFMVASFLGTGPNYVLSMLSETQRTALVLDWAMALAAGSMLIWPEKIAWLEARILAPFRGAGGDASPRERALVQGVGLLFLSVSTAMHFLLLKIMVL